MSARSERDWPGQVILTNHARLRCVEMSVAEDVVLAIVGRPDWTRGTALRRTLARSNRRPDITVVFHEDGLTRRVVTVLYTNPAKCPPERRPKERNA